MGGHIREGTWDEHSAATVTSEILRRAGLDSPQVFVVAENKARTTWVALQGKALSLLYRAQIKFPNDEFLRQWTEKVTDTVSDRQYYAKTLGPRRKMTTRETVAGDGGILVPPHLELQSYVVVLAKFGEAYLSLAQTLQIISGHLREGEGGSTLTEHLWTTERRFLSVMANPKFGGA